MQGSLTTRYSRGFMVPQGFNKVSMEGSSGLGAVAGSAGVGCVWIHKDSIRGLTGLYP